MCSDIAIKNFENFFHKIFCVKIFSYNFFEVVPFIPKESIEETCNDILESHVDALISDFEFSEQLSNVHYDGTDLVSLFLKKRENFPVFILTS